MAAVADGVAETGAAVGGAAVVAVVAVGAVSAAAAVAAVARATVGDRKSEDKAFNPKK